MTAGLPQKKEWSILKVPIVAAVLRTYNNFFIIIDIL